MTCARWKRAGGQPCRGDPGGAGGAGGLPAPVCAGDGGAVLDGRDIGTVICPEAEVKLYVTASAEVRSHRRWLEVGGDEAESWPSCANGMCATWAARMRYLRAASDAVVIDTSALGIDEAVAQAVALVGKPTAALIRIRRPDPLQCQRRRGRRRWRAGCPAPRPPAP